MLTFRSFRVRGKAESLKAEFDTFVDSAGDKFSRLIQPTLEFQANILGISPDLARPSEESDQYLARRALRGEIFRASGGIFGASLLVDPRRYSSDADAEYNAHVRLFAFFDSPRDEAVFEDFLHVAKEAFASELVSIVIETDRARSIVNEALEPVEVYNDAEVAAAMVLSANDQRALARAIKVGGDVFLEDVKDSLKAEIKGDIERVRQSLIDSGIVDTETVVICHRSGRLVNRIDSRDSLELSAAAGIRCSCGRHIEEERIEDGLSISTLGRDLLDKSRWMTIVLVEELRRIGVQDIYVEQMVGGDEIDCIALISGDVVLFELKDAEFSLGHAYSFNAKTAVLRPDHSMIVTTDKVGNDAREHFDRAKRAAMEAERRRPGLPDRAIEPMLVEGMENLSKRLSEMATKLMARDCSRMLRDILSGAVMDPGSVVKGVTSYAGSTVELSE